MDMVEISSMIPFMMLSNIIKILFSLFYCNFIRFLSVWVYV